eukprot:4416178-Pyramimonas_sp.AAC.1
MEAIRWLVQENYEDEDFEEYDDDDFEVRTDNNIIMRRSTGAARSSSTFKLYSLMALCKRLRSSQ